MKNLEPQVLVSDSYSKRILVFKNECMFYLMAKRIFDLTLSFAGLVFLLPMFVIIAILIKTDSEGPVFYRGHRVGLNGKMFYMYKFRSMKVNMEKTGGDTTALNDPRITKFGAILRKHKLDELPQLINVFTGTMSFVGPRPELEYYTNRYKGEEKLILTAKPGITDLSSLQFRSLDKAVGSENSDAVFEENILPEKNRLRLKYIKERSFLLDMKIIFKTVVAVCCGGEKARWNT